MKLLEQVLITLAYCDQFGFPLKAEEVKDRLVKLVKLESNQENQPQQKSTAQVVTAVSLTQVSQVLKNLVKLGLVTQQKPHYALAGQEQNFQLRQQRARFFKKKQLEISRFVAWISQIPGVKAVALTGSGAMENLKTVNDDLDFLVVTQNHCLWLVRLLVLLGALFQGKKNWPWQKDHQEAWCFNLWLTVADLSLPLNRRGWYEAYEVVQAQWIYDPAQTQARFFQANAWVKQYLVAEHWPKEQSSSVVSFNWLTTAVLLMFNYLAYSLQAGYRRWRFGHQHEHLTISQAFLHQANTARFVYQGWLKSVSKLFFVIKKAK
ncbi:MAG: hypothetical protein GF390_03765 [Candidatus Pacebacteria bacterium]|nr:hypothetical protein [Candidatus Paceibacterota bacterium]